MLVDKKQQQLQSKLVKLTESLNQMNVKLADLSKSDDLLRQKVNLPVLSEDEKEMGVGGSRELALEDGVPSELINESEKLIDQMGKKVEQQQASYLEIMRKYETNQKLFDCIPAIRPTDGKITSGFGMRFHPIYKVRRFHAGLDFSASIGTPVYATGNGVIQHVITDGGYGKLVIIDHGFGYKTVYAHLSEFNVHSGQQVKRGDVIAYSGNTGVSEGPHVHYEVIKNGVKMNPVNFMFDDLSPSEYIASLAEVE
ncbi:M23 family metallopeptidase [Chloroherpeton thalassium]|uniref:M23 family metallopeptidase n=1 Tax=Chloroherpeton thalassium TaxID=100716 RepID=UPI0003032428|nr:M23 family metallopeptidase [Chloroherpeton thalassium]